MKRHGRDCTAFNCEHFSKKHKTNCMLDSYCPKVKIRVVDLLREIEMMNGQYFDKRYNTFMYSAGEDTLITKADVIKIIKMIGGCDV